MLEEDVSGIQKGGKSWNSQSWGGLKPGLGAGTPGLVKQMFRAPMEEKHRVAGRSCPQIPTNPTWAIVLATGEGVTVV